MDGVANDAFASHDLEDIIAVVDRRSEIVADVAAASTDVRAYIGAEIRALLDNRDFTGACRLSPPGSGKSSAALAP